MAGQLVGALALMIEALSIVTYCLGFSLARLRIGEMSLPLSNRFIQAMIGLLILSAGLGFTGLVMDRRRRYALGALALFLPALILFGVLDGHF